MRQLTVVARNLADVVAGTAPWMTWNLLLAAVPAVLTAVLPVYAAFITLSLLSWRWAPFAVLATFVVIWLCHGATRAVVRSWIVAVQSMLRLLAPRRAPGSA